MFSRFDTIPECDGHPASQPATQPPSHVAVAITLYAKASSLNSKYLFARVIGLGKIRFYFIEGQKDICGFVGVMGLTCLRKLVGLRFYMLMLYVGRSCV